MNSQRSSLLDFIMSILTIIMGLLLIAMLFRTMLGVSNNYLTFQGFLEICSSAPTIDLSTLPQIYINGNWGLLDVIRGFLNTIATCINLSVYISVSLINSLVFIMYFMNNVFFLV